MTVINLANTIGCTFICGDENREVTAGYCGDLLSRVMGKAPENCAWVTVMGNVNAIAVAVLADVSCIILAEGALLDKEALQKAKEQNVTILKSEQTMFDLCVKIAGAIHL